MRKQDNRQAEREVKNFFDLIAPTTIRFLNDHYIIGDSYRSAWAIRGYAPVTETQALLSQIADKNGVTVRIYNRIVDVVEQKKIVANAVRKNKMQSDSNDLTESVNADANLQDVIELLSDLHQSRENLLHCAVFLELRAASMDALRSLQAEVEMELARKKIVVDHLLLRQKEGFLSCLPWGSNEFGSLFERVLPTSSVANLFPMSYSGKTDAKGLYIGRDKYGTNIVVDFDRRDADKTNSNILILGNSGQGKSYLMKLLLTNIRESGKRVLVLDPENEYADLCRAFGGSYIDYLSGQYIINPLEPRAWSDSASDADESAPEAFKRDTRLAQHISFLKDFFRSYKDFSDKLLDTIEILLARLYAKFQITEDADCDGIPATAFPTMSDFYALCEETYRSYDSSERQLYTQESLQEICLGIHSMCVGAESIYFNGHTNIASNAFLCFGVRGLLEGNKRLKDAMLFNILSYMNHQLLRGNTVASVDELYLFLTNLTAIEYLRNAMKRVRKKDSSLILASQNIEDFLLPQIREFTKPLFSIPTHQFLFHPGLINPKEYMDALQVESSEFELIRHPERGTCLFRCGAERFLLQVTAPPFKQKLFGQGGGR